MGLSRILLLTFILFLNGCNTSSLHDELAFCHEEERTALSQFKQSFTISCETASGLPGAYPKMTSWKPNETGNKTNCCHWDGVECDQHTGHVIELHLNSSCLYGSLVSNSSLFRLVHLQRLDLSDNHFNLSLIPSSIRNFPSLAYLDLSASAFSGRVPPEVSHLVKLSLLDLSFNTDPAYSSDYVGLLKLDASDFKNIAQNLTGLERLSLRFVNISSKIPDSIANLSFLKYLDLHHCDLVGAFPVSIFHLQNLKSLYVRDNQDLIGNLPEFNQSSRLTTLDLHGTGFSGNFPTSIGKIDSLKQLDVGGCYFSKGSIPSSIGNLRQLTYLDLSWMLGSRIPDSFANLTKLTVLRMDMCGLSGRMPSWLGTLSQLFHLDLAFNTFNSSLPTSFFNLTSLEILYIQRNQLNGTIEFQMFQSLENIKEIDLSLNHLDVVFKFTDQDATNFPQLTVLGLMGCKLIEFPPFLKNQRRLEKIDFYNCDLQGQVPKWIYNVSTETMRYFSLDTNHLSGQLPVALPWVKLQFFSVADNRFHGNLPIPASSTLAYLAQGNSFTGEVSPLFCNMSSLRLLDLSNNSLSGTIPSCFQKLSSLQALILSQNKFGGMFPQFLGNLSDNLVFLLLGNNSFHGHLPQMCFKKSNLRFMDISYNQLGGSLPRSLGNCVKLETLVMSNNNLSDVFPFWLRTLPALKVLALRQNSFLGAIGRPEDNQPFPMLRVLDISGNNFIGEFRAKYIFSVYAMRPNVVSVNESAYLEALIPFNGIYQGTFYRTFDSTFTLTSKGVDRYYQKIQRALTFIDISSNKFEGEIDGWIGNLKGLLLLNVSNNLFTGGIPLSFGNLRNLESLDLSSNKLSGKIPQQLAQLTFLSEFNVSHNILSGAIPTGTQLQGFGATSYEGNSELCGDPLPRKCGKSDTSSLVPTSDTEDYNSWFGLEFDWKFVVAGFSSGLLIGVVLADTVVTRRPEIFLDMAERLLGLMKMKTRSNKFRHR